MGILSAGCTVLRSNSEDHDCVLVITIGNIRGMDDDNFESRPYQCVYQYLKKYQAGENLDYFSFQQQAIHGTPQECLSHMMQ